MSHRPVIEDLHGIAYQRPAAHMRDYRSVLVPLLREGSVRYQGTFYQVDGGFIVPGTSPVPVLAGAVLGRYAGLEVYHRQFEREGVSSPGSLASLASGRSAA